MPYDIFQLVFLGKKTTAAHWFGNNMNFHFWGAIPNMSLIMFVAHV